MFWKRLEQDDSGEGTGEDASHAPEPEARDEPRSAFEGIEVSREVGRPAAILRVADELERRGLEVVELFEEFEVAGRREFVPIHARSGGEEVLVEVETRPWEDAVVEELLRKAAALRGPGRMRSRIEVAGVQPLPEGVRHFLGLSPAALLQLEFFLEEPEDLAAPEGAAEAFRRVAERHWAVELDYGLASLELAEELLLAAFHEAAEPGADDRRSTAPVLDPMVRGLGCYLGEVIRRAAGPPAAWTEAGGWGEGPLLDLGPATADPLGKARTFLEEGAEDSVSFFARYVLEEERAGA
jgi:hypothetical protein